MVNTEIKTSTAGRPKTEDKKPTTKTEDNKNNPKTKAKVRIAQQG